MAFAELSPLGQVVVCGLFLLMVYGWMQTGGRLVQWLAANFPNPNIGAFGVGVKPFQPIVDALNGFDNYVQRVFFFYLDATKDGWNGWCNQVASFTSEVTSAYDYLATETGAALHILRRSTIPALIAGWFAPGSQYLAWLVGHVAAIVRAGIHVAAVAPKVITNTITRVEHTATTLTKTIYRTVPAAVATAGAITLPRIRGLERDVTGVEKWIKEHADAVGLGAIVGVVGYALARLGLGSQQCSNVKKLNKGICGLHPSWLDALLADGLILASSISIVELAKECQAFLTDVETPLKLFVRELRDMNPIKAPDASAQLADYIAGRY